MITLVSSDNKRFFVDKEVAERSGLIKKKLEDAGGNYRPFSVEIVTGSILEFVLEYCKHHRGEPLPTADEANTDENRRRTTDIGEWDKDFITIGSNHIDRETLFEITLAAHYLEIMPLFDLGFMKIADMVKGQTPSEIMEFFRIVPEVEPHDIWTHIVQEWARDR